VAAIRRDPADPPSRRRSRPDPKTWIARADDRRPWLPIALLIVVCLVSTAARIAWIGEPCRAPCTTPADHILVFDETYYVNAARVIAGLRPPPGDNYAGAPAGVDPNSEHPQLAKLVIAGSIDLLGDRPLAWRLGSIVFGTLAILGMFFLARSAGGGRWLALGAACLMATDNLELVHGRIATLDVYVLAAIVWGVALYLRGRFLAAGVAIGVGAAFKEVAPYALVALAIFEALRFLELRTAAGRRALRFGACALTSAGVFVALLAIMERVAPPYDPQTRSLVGGGPLGQIAHMVSYAAGQTSLHGPQGIASYPWEWLFDYKPIAYLYINPRSPADGLFHVHPAAHFLGVVSPPILLLALPALVIAARRVLRGARAPAGGDGRTRGFWESGESGEFGEFGESGEFGGADGADGAGGAGASAATRVVGATDRTRRVGTLGLAWCLGTLVPYELLSLLDARTSYLYYMVIVMPGIYLVVADLVAGHLGDWRILAVWVGCVVVAAVGMYPFTPLP
jgi:hypothetical protein